MTYFDWSKYKRVFAFGCSFTSYTYPTWADIIFNETDAECYNFGMPGMGNLGIASRIAEANTMFNFCETDLVLVMYSTVFREDRWIEGIWRAYGCIYNQPFYNDNFVKNYVDPVGCMIRDLAQMELSSKYIRSLPCDNLILRSTDLLEEAGYWTTEERAAINRVTSLYSEFWDSLPPSLKETLFPDGWVVRNCRTRENKLFHDAHPITSDYYTYLKDILKLNLSDATYEYVLEADRKLSENTHIEQWDSVFPEVYKRQNTVYLF